MKNETVLFETTTPHPQPVVFADLLTDIEAVIKRHVILSDHAAAALAVWVLHTYTFELRDTVAYVAIESPEKRCGKTTLLSVLAAMARKPLIASNITVGALFRAIHTCGPSLFIDEADTFLAGNRVMRGIINSGNTRRTAYVLRLSRQNQRTTMPLSACPSPAGAGEGRGEGESGENPIPVSTPQSPLKGNETGLKKYSCWCPKVIAMIGQAPDTIADRSIVVPMSRKLVTESCAPLAELNTVDIKAKCARFALDARDAIAQAPKIRGEGLNDRAADTFDPLYVIARLAGDGWEQKLHAAALALNAAAQSNNSGAELLLDISSVFILSAREKIFSRELALALREGGHGLRSLALKYSAFNEYRISEILRPYGIKPSTMRIGKEVNKGYALADFKEVLARYIPKDQISAYIQELRQRGELQDQADAEAKQEAALTEQIMAAMPKDRVPSVPETIALLKKLKQENAGEEQDVASPALP